MIKELNTLFSKWKEAHEEECEFYERNKNSITDYIHFYFGDKSKLSKINPFKSFTPDGIIDEEAWDKGDKILFILKEANAESFAKAEYGKCLEEFEQHDIQVDNGQFWFGDMVRADEEKAEKDRIGLKLKQIGVLLTGKEHFSLKSVAYMNLNKRGGSAKANNKVISGYLEKYYEDYIKKEIEIIKPKIIVVSCGNYDFVHELKKYLDNDFKNVTVKFYYHPAARKRTEDYLKGIDNLI